MVTEVVILLLLHRTPDKLRQSRECELSGAGPLENQIKRVNIRYFNVLSIPILYWSPSCIQMNSIFNSCLKGLFYLLADSSVWAVKVTATRAQRSSVLNRIITFWREISSTTTDPVDSRPWTGPDIFWQSNAHSVI